MQIKDKTNNQIYTVIKANIWAMPNQSYTCQDGAGQRTVLFKDAEVQ